MKIGGPTTKGKWKPEGAEVCLRKERQGKAILDAIAGKHSVKKNKKKKKKKKKKHH